MRKALEVDPTRRYQSAAEFAAAIAPHVSGGAAQASVLMSKLFAEDFRAEEARFAAAFPSERGLDRPNPNDYQTKRS